LNGKFLLKEELGLVCIKAKKRIVEPLKMWCENRLWAIFLNFGLEDLLCILCIYISIKEKKIDRGLPCRWRQKKLKN